MGGWKSKGTVPTVNIHSLLGNCFWGGHQEMMLPAREAGGASKRGIDNTYINWSTIQPPSCTFSPRCVRALRQREFASSDHLSPITTTTTSIRDIHPLPLLPSISTECSTDCFSSVGSIICPKRPLWAKGRACDDLLSEKPQNVFSDSLVYKLDC
jgi:hypothetical protein